MCESLIIVYGKVRPQWVMRQAGEVLKILGRRKQKIIYDGPPDQKADLPFTFPGINMLICRQGICEACAAQLRTLLQQSSHQGKVA